MKERSGSLPSVDLAVRLSSACDATLDKVVLLASSPNWSSCSSILFCFFPVKGVEGRDEEEEVCCAEDVSLPMATVAELALSPPGVWLPVAPPPLPPPSSRSSESIQVERLTTRRSFSTSSWMEVRGFPCDWGLRSRPRRSASRVKEASVGARISKMKHEDSGIIIALK